MTTDGLGVTRVEQNEIDAGGDEIVDLGRFVGALTSRGFTVPFVLDGTINRDAFETYVAKVLVPRAAPGGIVVMDSLPGHTGPRVSEMIEAAGADCSTCRRTARTSFRSRTPPPN